MADRKAFTSPVIVVDRTKNGRKDETPVQHGLDRLLAAVEGCGKYQVVDHWTQTAAEPFILVGRTDRPVIKRLLTAEVAENEGIVYEWIQAGKEKRDALVVAGTDDRGLMYALLELAERIETDGIDVLTAVERTVETPDNTVRGVDRFLEDPAEDAWFYEDSFWETYLSRLARFRFNRLVLTTGYISDFMAPPYPFLVDVPGYPDVELKDGNSVTREENREQLGRIGQLCDKYGLEFVFATWQQQPRKSDRFVNNLPEGEELAEYCAKGMQELLTQCPEIEGIQLRVNWEAGVSSDEQLDYERDRAEGTAEAFWQGIIKAIDTATTQREHDVHLDLRAKGLTDDLIDFATETGLDITIPTKFWCESTGLPYHNSRMRSEELAHLEDPNKGRRYSYADFLGESRAYEVLYRLWSIGTNRIFVWGDPDFGRRFGESVQLGDGTGFEVTPPLSVKGGAADGEAWQLFADEDLRDFEYEDERYWAWYLTFGRFGYSTETSMEVWEREFERRFGEVAAAVREGYRSASKILPLLTAAHLTRHPATSNWAELDTGGALFGEHNTNPRLGDVSYAESEPSDPELFYRVEQFVHDRIKEEIDHRYTPLQVRKWCLHFAREVRNAIEELEKRSEQSGELQATLLDFRMLADLAEYHASQLIAAVQLEKYHQTNDTRTLRDAYRHAQWSVSVWERISERGHGTYHSDLSFVMKERGQWADYLKDLTADIGKLETLLEKAGADPAEIAPAAPTAVIERDQQPSFSFPTISLDTPDQWPGGSDLEVSIRTGEYSGFSDFRLHYRRANQYDGEFETIEMSEGGPEYRAVVPGEYIDCEFDLLIYVSAVNDTGQPVIIPGIGHTSDPFPYRVIETT